MAQCLNKVSAVLLRPVKKPLCERSRVNIINVIGSFRDQATGLGEGLGQTRSLFFTQAA